MHLWPQYTYLILTAMSFGINMSRFGQTRQETTGFVDLFVVPMIGFTMMYYGGFLAPLGWAP